MSEFYPPVSFYFELSFLGVTPMPEVAFKEVSGITMEMGIEEIARRWGWL